MIVRSSQDERWISNSWLVAASAGGPACVVDAGAPVEPLFAECESLDLEVSHVLLTHHHPDHVVHAERWASRYGSVIACHAAERELVPQATTCLGDGDVVEVGALRVEVLHVPGHTKGQLNFLVDGAALFTGDTLFAGSVGGTRGPGHGTFEQLRASILERLLALPDSTSVHPGHAGETTVGRERSENPFVLAWTAAEAPPGEPCLALGQPARLLVWARDYDGGHKAWVRFDDGTEDVVPGSRVERTA